MVVGPYRSVVRIAAIVCAAALEGFSALSAQRTVPDSTSSFILVAQTDTSYYFADIGSIRTLENGRDLLVRMYIDPRPGDYFEDSLAVPRIGQIVEGWRVDYHTGIMSRYDRALYDRFRKKLSYSIDAVSAGRRYPIGTTLSANMSETPFVPEFSVRG